MAYYERLNQLIFHDANSIKTLKHLDVQTLNKMLTMFDCQNWAKRLLDINLVEGFSMILLFFQKLEKDKLSEIVNTTISVRYGKKISYWAEWVNYLLSDYPYDEEGLFFYLSFLRQVSIHIGENTAKRLALDNVIDITRVFLLFDRVYHDNEDIVEKVLSCFSSAENQSEFVKCVLDSAPQLLKELFFDRRENMLVPRLKWMNILNLVVDYADSTQLSKLVVTILEQRRENRSLFDERQSSIWSDYLDAFNFLFFGGSSDEEIYKLLNCVAEKCGENEVKDLLLHDDGKVITRAFLWKNEHFIDTILACLSQETLRQVRKCVIDKMPEIIQEMFLYSPNLNAWDPCPRWMNTMRLIVDCADSNQLRKLVDSISHIYTTEDGRKLSIWSWSLNTNFIFRFFRETFFDKLDAFLKIVLQKLGEDDVKNLIFHNDGEIIRYAALKGKEPLLMALLPHLNTADQQEALRHALSTQTLANASDNTTN